MAFDLFGPFSTVVPMPEFVSLAAAAALPSASRSSMSVRESFL